MGWYADVVVGYLITLFKILARTLKMRRSESWREATASVAGASCQTSLYMPHPVAEIVYTYRIDGGFYGGVDEKPFFLESSAKRYAEQFVRGDLIIVRVKPGEPELSILLDQDQVTRNRSAASIGVSQ